MVFPYDRPLICDQLGSRGSDRLAEVLWCLLEHCKNKGLLQLSVQLCWYCKSSPFIYMVLSCKTRHDHMDLISAVKSIAVKSVKDCDLEEEEETWVVTYACLYIGVFILWSWTSISEKSIAPWQLCLLREINGNHIKVYLWRCWLIAIFSRLPPYTYLTRPSVQLLSVGRGVQAIISCKKKGSTCLIFLYMYIAFIVPTYSVWEETIVPIGMS